MAKREARPVQHISMFEYRGRVLPIEAMPTEDRCKAMARATLPGIRAMNPGWDVELKKEAYEIDLDAYFQDAPTVGSLFTTREAQEKADREYARMYGRG